MDLAGRRYRPLLPMPYDDGDGEHFFAFSYTVIRSFKSITRALYPGEKIDCA